jgi:hypothetical protein
VTPYETGGLAEGVGFEPTIRLPVYTLSKRAPSATRPSLRPLPAIGREYRCRGSQRKPSGEPSPRRPTPIAGGGRLLYAPVEADRPPVTVGER